MLSSVNNYMLSWQQPLTLEAQVGGSSAFADALIPISRLRNLRCDSSGGVTGANDQDLHTTVTGELLDINETERRKYYLLKKCKILIFSAIQNVSYFISEQRKTSDTQPV